MKSVFIPQSPGQQLYLSKLNNPVRPIKLVNGPAGSGKTLFACQKAVECLYNKTHNRIIITRPIHGVDEDIGYLPGDIDDKMEPWVRPVFDLMENYFSVFRIKQLIESKKIEISPLGYMRGRTFNDCFVLADEMQNSTDKQMKMMLTRLGENSQMVITGDTNQCDLPEFESGMVQFVNKLETFKEPLEYIDYIQLDGVDIQRHPAVKEVLDVYSS